MKVTILEARREGHADGIGLRFENGLLLETGSTIFLGKQYRIELTTKVNEIADALRVAGFDVEDRRGDI